MDLSRDFLDAQRRVPDPPADELVASVLAADPSAETLDLIKQLVQTGSPGHPELRERWRALLDSEDIGSVDWDAIDRATRLFRTWGPQITLSLCFGSLAGGYAAAHISRMLFGVSRLASDPRRRVFETTQMLIDVMSGGSLRPGAKGRETCERVRLMHAGVRHLMRDYFAAQDGTELRTPQGDVAWDQSWGAPINQELMAGTILTMSVHVLDCLDILGVRLSEDDQWAYVYTWFVAGRLMGVQAQMVPSTLEEARQFWEVTKRRQFAASPAGVQLERHLLAAVGELLPGRGLRFVPRALVIWLNGPEVARMVGLRPLRRHESLQFAAWRAAERLVARLEQRSGFVRRRLGSAGTRLIHRLDARELGHQRTPFTIPHELAGEWKLPTARRTAEG